MLRQELLLECGGYAVGVTRVTPGITSPGIPLLESRVGRTQIRLVLKFYFTEFLVDLPRAMTLGTVDNCDALSETTFYIQCFGYHLDVLRVLRSAGHP